MSKDEYGMKKSDKMSMSRMKTNGKKEFWSAPSMGNPKPKLMYKEVK